MSEIEKSRGMVLYPSPGAKAIAISMSVVHQHAGSPYIDGSRPEYQIPNFPIGMVFIIAIVLLIALFAVVCGLLKLYDQQTNKHNDKRNNNYGLKMPSLSTHDATVPRRDELQHASIGYLSAAALPLLSLYAYSKRKHAMSSDLTSNDQAEAAGMPRDERRATYDYRRVARDIINNDSKLNSCEVNMNGETDTNECSSDRACRENCRCTDHTLNLKGLEYSCGRNEAVSNNYANGSLVPHQLEVDDVVDKASFQSETEKSADNPNDVGMTIDGEQIDICDGGSKSNLTLNTEITGHYTSHLQRDSSKTNCFSKREQSAPNYKNKGLMCTDSMGTDEPAGEVDLGCGHLGSVFSLVGGLYKGPKYRALPVDSADSETRVPHSQSQDDGDLGTSQSNYTLATQLSFYESSV